MKPREYVLWLLFLVVCFAAGFIRGHLPPSRLRYALGEAEKVRILTVSKKLLPPNFITALERETHSSIEIVQFTTWDVFESQVISANPGFHLIIGPAHWAEDLSRRGLLLPYTSGMQSDIRKMIHTDFQLRNQDSAQYFLPVGWIVTVFASVRDISLADIRDFLRNPNIRLHLLYDIDLLRAKLNEWLKIAKKNPIASQFISYDLTQNLPATATENEIYEVEHLTALSSLDSASKVGNSPAEKKPSWYFNWKWPGRSLMVYGAMVPRSTPNRTTSQMLAREWLRRERVLLFTKDSPVATTLQELNESALIREKKPRHLRDLNLTGVLRPSSVNVQEFNELNARYKIQTLPVE